MTSYLGIDVGGTNIKYAVLDDDNQLLSQAEIATKYNKAEFLDQLAELILCFPDVAGIGISMPGYINSTTGYMRTAGALVELEETNLVEELRLRNVKLPIHVENDAKCVAISELACGNAMDIDNFVCITVGTGIGGGIVIDRKLLRGPDFTAGEIGGMRQDIDSEDVVAAICGISPARRMYADKHNLDYDQVSGREALSDTEVADHFYRHLTRLIYNLTYTLNPERFLLGGAISQDDYFIERVKREVAQSGINPNINCQIDRCKNTNAAGLIGAVYELKKMIK